MTQKNAGRRFFTDRGTVQRSRITGRRHKAGTGRMMHNARAVVPKQTSLTKETMMRLVNKRGDESLLGGGPRT